MEILKPRSSEVRIFISTDRNANNEFISIYNKKKIIIRHVDPGPVNVTFSLLLKRISTKCESFECCLPGLGYYRW